MPLVLQAGRCWSSVEAGCLSPQRALRALQHNMDELDYACNMPCVIKGKGTVPHHGRAGHKMVSPQNPTSDGDSTACLVLVLLNGQLDVADLHGQLLELLLPEHVALLKLCSGHLCVLPDTQACLSSLACSLVDERVNCRGLAQIGVVGCF